MSVQLSSVHLCRGDVDSPWDKAIKQLLSTAVNFREISNDTRSVAQSSCDSWSSFT